jgi:nitroimidazol reductase NimA-like FMN-containing flavoprotein (pyridoxamine 5'-phosphate oxidase superfamily)
VRQDEKAHPLFVREDDCHVVTSARESVFALSGSEEMPMTRGTSRRQAGADGAVPRTDRTRLRRYPKRASYAREELYAILDEAPVCHLGFTVDEQPYVIPTLCARDGDALYLHGSAASRTLKAAAGGIPVCVTATIVDGLVLARSAFFHSVNYRSVVVLGRAQPVDDPEEKAVALERFMDAVVPGRSGEVRAADRRELRATSILRLAIDEASAKVRNGPPSDLEEDLALDAWSGVIPLELRALDPVPDPTLRDGIPLPRSVAQYAVRHAAHPLDLV